MQQSEQLNFNIGDKVVYPSHGVGEIINIENQMLGGKELKVYIISFPLDKMTLKIPVSRKNISGLRAVSRESDINKIYKILQSKPQVGNRMWSRRAQEYENKINSGNIYSVAEVVRDLYKNAEVDRSYSERTIYESALTRLARELAILEVLKPDEVISKLIKILKEKSAA